MKALADALHQHLSGAFAPALGEVPLGTVDRLYRRVTRHLPLPGAEEGSPYIPPLYLLRIAAAVGLDERLARALAVAGACYFSAADLADDIADGDLPDDTGLHVTDVCRLLFVYQQALLALPDVSAETRLRLFALFAAQGQAMADGQQLDLQGTNALEAADPLTISRSKSGNEFAVFTAAPALLAGRDPAPWLAFGQAFGAAVQTLTDYLDLFLDPEGDDWITAKPTLALRHALAHPTLAAPLRLHLAGDRDQPARRGLGLWHLVQADAAETLDDGMGMLGADLTEAARAAGSPPILLGLRDELMEWMAGVSDALHEYRREPQPMPDDARARRKRAVAAMRAFVDADPPLAEAAEVHRWGLFDRETVVGDVFGPLIIWNARAEMGESPVAAAEALFGRADGDGWRLFPGVNSVPPDADLTGRALRLAARVGRLEHPAVRAGADALTRAMRRDGLFETWLGRGRHDAVEARFGEGLCPVVSANALLGLWAAGFHRKRLLRRGLAALAEALLADPAVAPASPFYRPVQVDAACVRALRVLGPFVPADERGDFDRAVDAALARLRARRRLDGRFGDPLETAISAWTLHRCRALDTPEVVLRALVDDQQADGGYAALPLRRTFAPHDRLGWYASRRVTTALIWRTIEALDAPG
ncbi:MAG: polyprenyl synthetase family protein [Myxococcales bacterium]|nr:polyprenyl synthetase family protein [Myxococcales bacterium]